MCVPWHSSWWNVSWIRPETMRHVQTTAPSRVLALWNRLLATGLAPTMPRLLPTLNDVPFLKSGCCASHTVTQLQTGVIP